MTSTRQFRSIIGIGIKQVLTMLAKAFSILLIVYLILLSYMMLARWITTPKIVEVLTISDESVIKLRSLETYYNERVADYIEQHTSDP